MEIRKEDIQILDTILDALVEDYSVNSDFLILNNIVEKDLKNPRNSRKEAGSILESLNIYISFYCGKSNKKGAFGDDLYFFTKDHRTVPFKYNNGGFKGLYNSQQAKRIKEKETNTLRAEIDKLTKVNLEFRNEEARYNKKLRKWKFISLILGLIATILSIYTFILK